MTKKTDKKRLTGYAKYINYKWFSLACFLLALVVVSPFPKGMLDVGVEYSMGRTYCIRMITNELFSTPPEKAEKWQVLLSQIITENMIMGASSKELALRRSVKWCEDKNIPATEESLSLVKQYLRAMPDEKYHQLILKTRKLMYEELSFNDLSQSEKKNAYTQTKHLKICIGIMLFVITLFVTEGMPLPGVAFCVGLILLFSGIVGKDIVQMSYWSDPVWFIMGSLMFACAFVKTGVDKRICLAMFGKLARPNLKWITLVLFLVITPLAGFVSDHALAAMFLPIGMLLYRGSLTKEIPVDPELAKMLMITIAMACNIGGCGAPSGAARNVIMMGYLEDMFGISIGYSEWMRYLYPFGLLMIPISWAVINWRFKPRIKDLSLPMDHLREDIKKMGPWTKQQKLALVIFLMLLFGWITEKNLLKSLIGFRLGIGGIAVLGGIGYMIAGITNWKDYQTRVDWGVVWLYAGAVLFGRALWQTGGAYWLARTVVNFLVPFGFGNGYGLLFVGNTCTSFLTNLMADGPAAAAMGPITLNMAGIAAAGSSLIPFIGMTTALASSFAYILIIGTPPNAIVYASGYLEAKDYLRVGAILFVVAHMIALALVGLYWTAIGFPGFPHW